MKIDGIQAHPDYTTVEAQEDIVNGKLRRRISQQKWAIKGVSNSTSKC